MALKRWSWVWGPALAAALVAVLALPPAIPSDTGLLVALGVLPSWDYSSSRDVHREAVEGAVNGLRRRYGERLAVDSVLAAARGPRAVRSGDGKITVVYERPLTRDSAQRWLAAAVGELDLYPASDGQGVPVVVALLSDPARWKGQEYGPETRLLLSAAESRGACVVTVDLHRHYRYDDTWSQLVARDASGRPVGRFLDTCALYARFGVPGAAAQWFVPTMAWWYYRSPLSIAVQEARRSVRRADVAHDEQVRPLPWSGEVYWIDVGCLHGSLALCGRWAGFGEQAQSRWFYSYARYSSRVQVVGSLLATGSPAQFAAFWRSSLPTGEALAAAYGRPPGQLVMAAFAHWYNIPEPGGPQASAKTVLAGLFWAGLALAAAVLAGKHWTVEP